MDSSVVDLKKFKGEALDILCGCNFDGTVFVEDILKDYLTICRGCGKKIYGLNCPKCQSGFSYPENYKTINKVDMSWKCETCGQINKIPDNIAENTIPNYKTEEIPKEVRKKYEPKPISCIIIFVVVLIFIFLVLRLQSM